MKIVTKNKLTVCASIFIFLAIMLTSCSGGIPSESNARNVFESKYSEAIKSGVLKIDSFNKTNGQKLNMNGAEVYKVEYKAKVIYPKGILPECAGNNWPMKIYWKCYYARLGGTVSKQPGQTETINGELVFEKTEKGWKAEDGKIY